MMDKKINVGLIGFGKTGKSVASVLLKDKTINLQWVVRKTSVLEHRSVPEFLGIESDEPGLIYSIEHKGISELIEEEPVEVIVDFSSESGMDYYLDEASRRSITVVSAISSLPEDRIAMLKKASEHTRVLWSPNITLGINFMILAAQTLQEIAPDADIEILEEHFRDKPEVSGTAVKIATALNLPAEAVKTFRAGGIIGTHEILFGFPFQVIRLRHESISREAFGNGAKYAIHELQDRDNGMYKMEDLIGRHFAEKNKHYLEGKGTIQEEPALSWMNQWKSWRIKRKR